MDPRDATADGDSDSEEEDQEALLVHTPGSGIVDPGCARALIGLETLRDHEEATGENVKIVKEHREVTFQGFNGERSYSIGVCVIPWKIGRHVEQIEVYVVPGRAGLLLSKPLLKRLKCTLDFEHDELVFPYLGERVRLRKTRGSHYEVPLDGSTARSMSDRDFQ